MAEWKIVSTTDPNLDNVKPGSGPGEYIFTPPTDIARNVYTIYYIDGDISGETEYIVSSADCFVDECATNFYPPPVCFDSDDERYTECSRMTVGHDYGNVNTKYTIDPCWKLIGTSKTNNITGIVVNNDGTSNIAYSDNNTRENIQSVATYKFKNEKANITAESFVTIIQEPNKCYLEDCSSTNVPKPTANVSEVSSTGGNVTISYSETECWEYKTSEITAGNSQVSSFANNVIAVKENESSTSDITITAKYTFKNRESGVECYPTVDVTQKGVDQCKIDHECPTVQGSDTYEVSAAGASGADAIKITYSPEKNSCWTLAVTSGGDTNQIDSIVTGISSTTITVNSNTDGSTKTMTVTFTFTNTMTGEDCGKTITITQAAGCVCSDIYFTFTIDEINFPISGINWTKIGELSVTKNGCIDAVSATSVSEGLTVRTSPNGTNKKDVEIKIDAFAQYQETIKGIKHWVTARKLNFKTTLNGEHCGNTYELYQQAFRGTDNGADTYANGEILSEPLFFIGNPGDGATADCTANNVKVSCRDFRIDCPDCVGRNCDEYGIDRRNSATYDEDSVICTDGAVFIDANGNKHQIDSDWTDGIYFDENGQETTDTENYWIRLKGAALPGIAGVGMLRIEINEEKINDTGKCRFMRFKVSSEPDPENPAKKILHGDHIGEEAAREWYYDIVQMPKGMYLCNIDDKHPENYIITGLKSLEETCDDCNYDVHGQCRCERP